MGSDSISQTIDRALKAAGLNTQTGLLARVTTTIDDALASAGLTRRPPPQAVPPPPARPANAGQFLTRSHAIGRARRDYRLYVPSSYRGDAAPLILMLHGCKQNPDDFAAGTRMNELAERSGFLVAYPAQTARENGSNCWNWFEPGQQSRAGEEPALLAGIVGHVGGAYAVDPSRVFVAGLSAGAAMAVILGTTHPEVFKGVAAHSGLPVGAAHDVPSAFAAMHGRNPPSRTRARAAPVPTIVFHGDADHTVVLANGTTIVEQAVGDHAATAVSLRQVRKPRETSRGRTVSTTLYVDDRGRSRVEEWVVHGGAHAWSGGSANGSYTDPSGPDASAEIVRFFLNTSSA